jgi:hypothetical protein
MNGITNGADEIMRRFSRKLKVLDFGHNLQNAFIVFKNYNPQRVQIQCGEIVLEF